MDEETKMRLAQMDRTIDAENKWKADKAALWGRVVGLLEGVVERLFQIITEERAKNG